MQVTIAEVPITLTVPFNDQDNVRETEKAISDLYNNWRLRFPNKSQEALLAMIAYQYASYYQALSANNAALGARIRQTLATVEEALDSK